MFNETGNQIQPTVFNTMLKFTVEHLSKEYKLYFLSNKGGTFIRESIFDCQADMFYYSLVVIQCKWRVKLAKKKVAAQKAKKSKKKTKRSGPIFD